MCGHKLDPCMIGEMDRERWYEWVGVELDVVGVRMCLMGPLICGHGVLVTVVESR